jgi:hypothetical protein
VAARELTLDALFGSGIECDGHRGSIPLGQRVPQGTYWSGSDPTHAMKPHEWGTRQYYDRRKNR